MLVVEVVALIVSQEQVKEILIIFQMEKQQVLVLPFVQQQLLVVVKEETGTIQVLGLVVKVVALIKVLAVVEQVIIALVLEDQEL
jgi:hypothetical protein